MLAGIKAKRKMTTKSARTENPKGNQCGSTKSGAWATASKLIGWKTAKQIVPAASAISMATRRIPALIQIVIPITTSKATRPEVKLTTGKPGVARLPIQFGSATFDIWITTRITIIPEISGERMCRAKNPTKLRLRIGTDNRHQMSEATQNEPYAAPRLLPFTMPTASRAVKLPA
jgi:hypothetical protein